MKQTREWKYGDKWIIASSYTVQTWNIFPSNKHHQRSKRINESTWRPILIGEMLKIPTTLFSAPCRLINIPENDTTTTMMMVEKNWNKFHSHMTGHRRKTKTTTIRWNIVSHTWNDFFLAFNVFQHKTTGKKLFSSSQIEWAKCLHKNWKNILPCFLISSRFLIFKRFVSHSVLIYFHVPTDLFENFFLYFQ